MLNLSDDNTHDDSQAILRARRLLAAGHLDVASRAVISTNKTLDCANPAVMQQLRAMQHPCHLSHTTRLSRRSRTTANYDGWSDVATTAKLAGHPVGNGGMIAVLADSRTFMEGLRCILLDISGGHVPLAVRRHITATRLIALAKPNNTPRPIAMAELFYRMAAVRAVRSVMDDAARILGPNQQGVGTSAGCEHIIHCMQHSLSHIGGIACAAGGDQDRHPQCVQHVPAPTTAHRTVRHSRPRSHPPHRPLGILTANPAHTAVQRALSTQPASSTLPTECDRATR